jgi:hypothetical protein
VTAERITSISKVTICWLPIGLCHAQSSDQGSVAPPSLHCTIIDHFSVFEFELVALFLTLPLKNGWQW